jgi:cytochrome c peroxidase
VNAPTTFNAAGNIRQFWDGRAADLKEQAGGPPLNPMEMGFSCVEDWNVIADKLGADPQMVALFAYVFGDNGITADTITTAIAAYEQTLVTPDSAFDRYLKGDEKALTDSQKAGLKSFVDLGCATCHSGPTLGGISFEYINTHGDLRAAAAPEDYMEGAYGLRDFTKKEEHKDMFRVPNLRNVALTAPYFHTGTVNSLKEAVRIMIDVQNGAGAASDDTVQNITRFLEAQTGKLYGKPANALTPEAVQLKLASPRS